MTTWKALKRKHLTAAQIAEVERMVQRDAVYISVAEAASLTGRPAVTVRWWARKGRVRAYLSRHVWRVHKLDACAYEGERRQRGAR